MSGKSQADVGKDFDNYARDWSTQGYDLEVKSPDGVNMERAGKEEVRVPGDEWGRQSDLERIYAAFFAKYGKAQTNVLEIGSGAGRLTEVIVAKFRDQIADYHTLDVSSTMTGHLSERLAAQNFHATHHIGGSADLDNLPQNHFDIVISQSCWSHINLYDQYLYLRDIRKVVALEGILMVNGIFMLGGNNDWSWNRFRRRVSQKENDASGVYHEFTGHAATMEMALRLGWEVVVASDQGFILRFRHARKDIMFKKWSEVPSARKKAVLTPSLQTFLETGKGQWRQIGFRS